MIHTTIMCVEKRANEIFKLKIDKKYKYIVKH